MQEPYSEETTAQPKSKSLPQLVERLIAIGFYLVWRIRWLSCLRHGVLDSFKGWRTSSQRWRPGCFAAAKALGLTVPPTLFAIAEG
jgi:hypothetical protein